MRQAWLPPAAATATIMSLAGLMLVLDREVGAATGPAVDAPAMSEQVRYIGRDPVTSMAARVDDRFIAEHQEAIARYGLDEREPVPPPGKSGPELRKLRIPALGIDHATDRFGLDAYGRLDVPQDTTTIGWHPAYSALPGDDGSTFLAAHYEYEGAPGVFYTLSTLAEGDLVFLEMEDGSTHSYRVTSTVDYELAVIDMGALLRGREGVESVVLMTCSGPVVDGNYQWRTVVLAERVDAALPAH